MNKYLSKEYLMANKEKVIKIGVILIILIAAFFIFLLKTGDKEEAAIEGGDGINVSQTEEVTEEEEVIIADVSGAVKNPMVVELEPNSRIDDAIAAAGGLTKTADISNINRAAIVNDGDKIFVPNKGDLSQNEQSVPPSADGNSIGQTNGKININTADSTKLQELSGVGPATSEKILVFRSTNGSFKKIEDLKKVNGIGEKTFEKLRDFITV